MSHERPDALLKSALEKIVYFEARASQLSNDVTTATAERERLKSELAQSSQREIELRRVIAELEVRSTRAHAEREEAASLAEALRRERAELLGKILEASRLNGDGNDPFDLASFIAELRSEVLLRRENAPVGSAVKEPIVAPLPSAPVLATKPTHIEAEAESLKAQGRLSVSASELASLERAFPFPGRTEETLFGFSVRELSAPDSSARARAAERLTALGHPAAAPALATALHAETEASVKVALLGALSTLAKAEAVPVVLPQLSASAPDVRIAALKALLKLDPTQAGPHLAAAVKDPDSAVRRRASLLALGLRGSAALELGETAIRDVNADVRSLAALVLGASGMESARPWLMQAMRDPELRVRRSASQALSRLLGQDVSELVELDEAQRRREVRRLAHVPANPVKAKVVAALPRTGSAEPAHLRTAALVQPVDHSGPSRHASSSGGAAGRVVASALRDPRAPVLSGDAAPALAGVDASRSVTSAPPARAVAAHSAGFDSIARPAHDGRALGLGVNRAVAAHSAGFDSIAPSPHDARALIPNSVGVNRVVAREVVQPVDHSARGSAVAGSPASRVAVVETEVVSPAAPLEAVLSELRTAIRGHSAEALAASLGATLESVRAACAQLIQHGHVVRRGHKYFVA